MRPHDLDRCQLLVRFGYDGARFRGLQPQAPGIPTAGWALKERLTEAAGVAPKALNFAARTDAGVHAEANLATCYFREVDDAAPLIARLESDRDDGLTAVRAWRVPPSVHARGSARGKRYRYVVEDEAADAHLRRERSWPIAPALDVAAMQEAARRFEGTHDFSSLRAGDCSAAEATKTLARVHVERTRAASEGGPGEGGRIVVELSGNAFLRKMVRNLVGVLVEVGAGLRAPADVAASLAARARRAAGLCAPPEGLTLVAVGCAWPEDGSALLPELASLEVARAGASAAAAHTTDDE